MASEGDKATSPWVVRMSKTKHQPYFFNTQTQESSWVSPDGLGPDDIKALPGAELLAGGRPAEIHCAHLLVKHKDSRRPSSWREADITRSKDEAIAILKTYQTHIDGDAERFRSYARKFSDCSSAHKDGDLGYFSKGMMQKPFEEAAFALSVGGFSDIVETESGVHLIHRLA